MSALRERRAVIITGATAGLGLHTAANLAARDWHVVLPCRSRERGEAARTWIRARTDGGEIDVRELDVGELRSVRTFVQQWEETAHPPLFALIGNAGVQLRGPVRRNGQGLELTFATNHLGHFLLARLLFPRVETGGRIVFVASDTHDPRNLTFMPAPVLDNVRAFATGDCFEDESVGLAGRRRYTTSKLCNVLCAYEWDRRLRIAAAPPRVGVHSFDPGFMPSTSLGREYGPLIRVVARYLLPALIPFVPNVNRVGTSARRLADLATHEMYDGVYGQYFSRGRATKSSKASHDVAKARELWDVSCELAALASMP